MARFDLRDFRKQASFFLREKLNDARLALTDVSRIQLLTEEATNDDSWGPEPRTMAILAEAAFELEEYDRIVQVLRSRLDASKKRQWRQLHKTLVLLEYLLTHGPDSIGREFRADITSMEELSQFNFTDQEGGSIIRKMADRVLELLNNPDFRKEERTRVRKVSVGIQGFGSSTNQESSQNKDVEQSRQGDLKCLSFNESYAIGDAAKTNPQLTQDISSNPLSEASALASRKVSKGGGQIKLFKKSLSSPGLFRPHLSQQPAEDRVNESEGVNTCLLDATEERDSHSCHNLQAERGKLMRWISEESTEEGIAEDENMNKTPHEVALSLFEGIDAHCLAENCKSSMQKHEGEQLFMNFSNCHNLPYPVSAKSRVDFQHQWQPSNLIDCRSKLGEAA